MRTITTNCLPGSVKKRNLKFYSLSIVLYAIGLFFSTGLFAQTITFPTSCTSKDLTLLKASLPAPAGDRCACSGDRILILGIHNGTSSIRTSFALWGTLVRKDAGGNILETKSIFACAGPIGKSGDYFLNATTIIINGVPVSTGTGGYPTIHIDCGQSLDIQNMHLAWTSANSNETCDVLYNNPGTINPKCGTQDLIRVDLGVSSTLTTTNSTCTTNGSIKVEPYGGIAPYQVCLYRKNSSADSVLIDVCRNVAANGSTTFSELAIGDYTIKAIDNMNEADVTKRCFLNKTASVSNPDNVGSPNYTTTDPGCRQLKGTVNVTSPQTGVIYTLEKPLGTVKYTASGAGVFSNVDPDTYILKATKGACSATTSNIIINQPPAAPAAPSPTNSGPICAGSTLNLSANITADSYSWTGPGGFTSTVQNPGRPNTTTAMAGSYSLVITVNGCSSDAGSTIAVINAQPLAPTIIISQQPNLCSNSTGSISVCSPNLSYTYTLSVNNGAFGDPKTGSSISFTGLAAGSNPVIKVSNGTTGCDATQDCSHAVTTCPTTPNPTSTLRQTEQMQQLSEPSVNAYPNPFNDKVKFVVNAPASGNGSLEVYNIMGQKIKTVYQGHINAGDNSFELTIPKKQQATLIYMFRVGDKKVTGKLLQLNN